MGLRLTEFLAKLSKYIDVSSEMQVGAIEFACARKGKIDVKLFCQLYGLRYKQALDLMGRLHRRGLVKKDGTGIYTLTEKGWEVCRLISSLSHPLTLRTIKLLMVLGTRLSSRLPLRLAIKHGGCGREEVLRALAGLVDVEWTGEEEVLALNPEGERLFRELVETVGLGPNTTRVLAALTRSPNPSTALGRFIMIHLSVSALIIYEVFAAPILGAGVAILWITITLIVAGLLALKK